MGTIKIFQMNDWDWCAAETAEQAIHYYTTQEDWCTGVDWDNPYDPADCRELTEEELDRNKFIDDDRSENRVTFREALEQLVATGASFPRFFASTEY